MGKKEALENAGEQRTLMPPVQGQTADSIHRFSGQTGSSVQSGVFAVTDQTALPGFSVGSSTSIGSGSPASSSPPLVPFSDPNNTEHNLGLGPTGISSQLASKTNRELRNESPYNPVVYTCKGYDAPGEYIYFDGVEGTADLRFLIDLESPSMERLRDVRPYLYYIGYWHDQDAPFPNNVIGDAQVENYYVRAGRIFLQTARKAGHGYFMVDRDWKVYNTGTNACMPYTAAVYEDNEADIGVHDYHDDDTHDTVQYIYLTNIRHCLPDQELLTAKAWKEWDRFIQDIYAGHAINLIQYYHWDVAECQFYLETQSRDHWTLKEAQYMYPDPHGPGPFGRTPAQARELLARDEELDREVDLPNVG